MEKAFSRIDNSNNEYLSKNIKIKFLFGLFKLNVFTEYRQNDEWKHFITLYFMKWNISYICFRTGSHSKIQDMYTPQLTVYGQSYTDILMNVPYIEKDKKLIVKHKNVEVQYTYGM